MKLLKQVALLAAATTSVADARDKSRYFDLPLSEAGFVPLFKSGESLSMYLSGVRRTAFPMIAQNMPERTLFVPSAVNQSLCGLNPAQRDGPGTHGTCFTGLLPWMWSRYDFDRNDYILKLHSTNVRVDLETLSGIPGHQVQPLSAAPWESLIAEELVSNQWTKFCEYEEGAPRRLSPEGGSAAYGFALAEDLWVDTTVNFNLASSPILLKLGPKHCRHRVMDDGRRALSGRDQEQAGSWSKSTRNAFGRHADAAELNVKGSQFEFMFGYIHEQAEPRAALPKLTALQYIFQHPHLNHMAHLIRHTCYCLPEEASLGSCQLSYLCFILDRAVFTMFVPDDDAFSSLSPSTVDYLFQNKDVAAAVIAYHVLGEIEFVCPWKGFCPIVSRRRVLSEQQALSQRVNRRLDVLETAAEARRLGKTLDPTVAADASKPIVDPMEDVPSGAAAGRSLGNLGTSAGVLPHLPDDVSEFLLTTTVPLIVPFPNWEYHAQLGDMIHNNRTVRVQTFNPLFNVTQVELNDWALLQQIWRRRLQPENPVPSPSPDAATNVLSVEFPFTSSELVLSYGPIFPCKESCATCDACNLACAQCTATNFGRQLWACDSACACSTCCGDCTTCLAANPAPLRRQLQAAASAPPSITITCVDPVCGVMDPACVATTVQPWVDIETTNALLHKIDNVLLPPNVLLALWGMNITPYVASPSPDGVVPVCPYTAANVTDTFYGLNPLFTALLAAFV